MREKALSKMYTYRLSLECGDIKDEYISCTRKYTHDTHNCDDLHKKHIQCVKKFNTDFNNRYKTFPNINY
jgi:hypothetical protein